MSTYAKNKHYDASLEYNVSLYDRLPYIRDEDVCGAEKVALTSGNVVKNYSFKDDSPCVISNHDEQTKAYLYKLEQEILKGIQKEHDDYVNEAIKTGLTNKDGQ